MTNDDRFEIQRSMALDGLALQWAMRRMIRYVKRIDETCRPCEIIAHLVTDSVSRFVLPFVVMKVRLSDEKQR